MVCRTVHVLVALVATGVSQAFADTAEKTSFDFFLLDGGGITTFIMLPLSVATIGLIFEHAIRIRRGVLLPADVRERITEDLEQRRYKEVLATTAGDDSLLAEVIHSGLTRAGSGLAAVERGMEEVLEVRAAALFRRIEFLNIIGNISPMIGLFGTVFGMIQTFSKIVESGGQPDAQQLAGGISVALVTTFWGLLIAIPALTVFHIMRNRIDALLAECAHEAEELLTVFRPRLPASNGSTASRTPQGTTA